MDLFVDKKNEQESAAWAPKAKALSPQSCGECAAHVGGRRTSPRLPGPPGPIPGPDRGPARCRPVPKPNQGFDFRRPRTRGRAGQGLAASGVFVRRSPAPDAPGTGLRRLGRPNTRSTEDASGSGLAGFGPTGAPARERGRGGEAREHRRTGSPPQETPDTQKKPEFLFFGGDLGRRPGALARQNNWPKSAGFAVVNSDFIFGYRIAISFRRLEFQILPL
jgi:hypothetical protein